MNPPTKPPTHVPFPKKRSLWPMVLVPFLLGFFYLGIAYPRFVDDINFVWAHLLLLSFWMFATGFVMVATRELLIKLHIRFILLPTVIIPTISCYSLYVIYTVSIVGDLAWGTPIGYKRLLSFIPYLFDLADNFDFPRALVVALLIIPLVAMVLIFMGRMRELIIWHFALKETFEQLGRPKKRKIVFLATFLFVVIVSLLVTADPNTKGFLNFNQDPILIFFKGRTSFYAMTKERLLSSQKDQMAERLLKRRVPRVHNVFLFVVDALRADHLPSYGYARPITPYLSKLFASTPSQKIDKAFSTGLDTVTGTVCLMNSKNPKNMSEYNFSLADYFFDQGYWTALILAGDHRWQVRRKAFGRKIDLMYDGSEHPGPKGSCDDELAVKRVEALQPDEGGYHFFYIHLISVHPLGHLEEKFERYKPIHNIVIDDSIFWGRPLDQITNMYDDRILQMDDVMRRIMFALGKKGYLKDYVAVLTADHGQLLGEGGRYGHGHYAAAGDMRVPMIFFGSKSLPKFPETHFGVQLDVAPTLTDLALGDFPSTWQGQSLLRPRKNPWTYHLSPYSNAGQEGAVVYYTPGHIYKYSRPLAEENNPGNLYDLENDIAESKNLIDQADPKFVARMRRQAHEHFQNY